MTHGVVGFAIWDGYGNRCFYVFDIRTELSTLFFQYFSGSSNENRDTALANNSLLFCTRSTYFEVL